ncbi:MAG: hypothetical protein O2840_01000 [bacterium]|nr:hypothetical protein [bacterium]
MPKEIRNTYKHFLFPASIFVVLLCSLVLRLHKLSTLPSVISHDEIYYIVEAKTISISGKDPTGTWHPSNLIPANSLFAELPGTVMAAAAKLFPENTVFAGRLTSAVMGALLPLFLAGVVFELSKSKRLFFITFLLASVNPWMFQFSRMTFDSLFSLFFYFFGFYIFLRLSGYKKLLALVPFILGFYQYQGLKVIFFPFVLITAAAVVLQGGEKDTSRKRLQPVLVFLLLASVFFVWQVVRITNLDVGARTNDLIFANRSNFQIEAGVQQQQSIENKFQRVFVNSYTVMARSAAQAYLESFNPRQLFVHGEARRNPFSVWSLGIFHLIDAPLMAIGLITLWRKKSHKTLALIISLLLLIGPLPSALQTNDTWIMFRSSLLFISLLAVSSYGMYTISKLNRGIFTAVILTYSIFVAQYFYEYFYRYPIYGTQGKYFAERVLGEYIKRTPKTQTISVYADEKYFVFLEILVSANLITPETITQLQRSFQSEEYRIANVSVDTACFPTGIDWSTTTVIKDSTTAHCVADENEQILATLPKSAIASLLDSGAIFTVYNDQFCAQYGLGNSLFIRKDVFNFEKLSDEAFCRYFFVSQEK